MTHSWSHSRKVGKAGFQTRQGILCARNHNTAKVKFNNTVLFLPLSSILESMVFIYLAGDKKSLFEPKLIYVKKKKKNSGASEAQIFSA